MKSVVLEDEKEYLVIDEITDKTIDYLYLVNKEDEKDICVRKFKKGEIVPLKDDTEFQKAMTLYTKKNKEKIKDLLNL